MSLPKAKLAWRNRRKNYLLSKGIEMDWLKDLKEDFEKGKTWIDDNEDKMISMGEEGVKLFALVNGIFNGGITVETPQVFTKWDDVNEILAQAQGVQEVIDSKLGAGFFEDFINVVVCGIKFVTLGAALL